MERYLGVRPETDAEGVLQDIHWSQAGIGYFPDYLLGSMLSAQLWDAMTEAVPSVETQIEHGSFDTVNTWLAERVQRHGGKFTLPEMAEHATGEPFDSRPYLDYLTTKYSALYGV
jgi:carboxypeptidase Taq